jgi:hypothetical protein
MKSKTILLLFVFLLNSFSGIGCLSHMANNCHKYDSNAGSLTAYHSSVETNISHSKVFLETMCCENFRNEKLAENNIISTERNETIKIIPVGILPEKAIQLVYGFPEDNKKIATINRCEKTIRRDIRIAIQSFQI